MEKRYEQILHLPHHVSSRHLQMSVRDRAAQFAPFSALAGYDEAIKEAEKSSKLQLASKKEERIPIAE